MRETRAPHGSSPHRLRRVERMAPDDDVAASSGEHGSTTVTRVSASPRGTNSRPRQKGRPRADARTVPPCCSRADRASLCLAQRNPPMRRDVPLARPHPSSRPRRQPTQRAAPEPTADAFPKSPPHPPPPHLSFRAQSRNPKPPLTQPGPVTLNNVRRSVKSMPVNGVGTGKTRVTLRLRSG